MFALLNMLAAPLLLPFSLVFFLFRYGEEFHQNPRAIGIREWTPVAQWSFREFNELPHFFEARLASASPLAQIYCSRFPSERTAAVARLISFVASAFAVVLIVLSLVNETVLLQVELSPGRSVLWYLGVFGGLIALTRPFVSFASDQTPVDVEQVLRDIADHTHYLPKEWRTRLHSQHVRQAFGQFFEYKIISFLREMLGMLLVPYLLWYRLPACAEGIVDFVRDFSVHVDGLGHVCSFAVFDFQRHGNAHFGAPVSETAGPGPSTARLARSRNGKMEKSFLSFMANQPEWKPSETGERYLDNLVNAHGRPNHGSGYGAESTSSAMKNSVGTMVGNAADQSFRDFVSDADG